MRNRYLYQREKGRILIRYIRPFFAAVSFFTIVPVPGFLAGTPADISRSLPWFVVVGAIIGAGVSCIDSGLCLLLPVFPASAVTILILIGVSGGLHMDGLADTADGFFSSRPRERMLEIMRDSRIGAMGVIAIVAMILIKFLFLASLTGKLRPLAVFLMPLAGRFAPVFMIVMMRYVHGQNGIGTLFKQKASHVVLLISSVLFFCICFVAAGYHGFVIAAITVLFVLIFSFWCQRKIGGWTGDTLGASVELSEAIPLFVFLVLTHGRIML